MLPDKRNVKRHHANENRVINFPWGPLEDSFFYHGVNNLTASLSVKNFESISVNNDQHEIRFKDCYVVCPGCKAKGRGE